MDLVVRAVDPRELAELRSICDQLALEHHDPIVQTLATIDPSHPAVGDADAVQIARDKIRTYLEFHREHPLRVMPSNATSGPLVLCVQRANGAQVRRQLTHFAQHVGIYGATGTGKSTLIASLLPQLLAAGVHLVVVDRKDDTRHLAAGDERFLIIDSDASLNIIQQPKGITLAEHITTIVTCIARAFFGGEHLKQVLTEALNQAFAQHNTPSLDDVLSILRRMSAKNDTFSRRDALTGVVLRLQRFAALYPGMFRTRVGLTLDDLFTHSLYLPISAPSEASEFLTTFLIHDLLFYQRHHQRRDGLEYVIVLDEGLSVWNANAANIDRQPLLSYVQSLVREYRIGMIVTSTSVQLLDPLLKANLGTQIVMNLTSAAESSEIARTFGLTPREHEYLNTKLTKGECIIKLADEWRHPILATFPRSTTEKSVNTSDWNAAIERTSRLAHRQALAAREGIEGNEQPMPSHTTAPSSSPPSRVAPVVVNTTSPNERVALNQHAAAIIGDVAEHPLTLTTPNYQRCGLRLSEGDRAKTLLINLGFLEAHRVRTGAGRGKTGSALRLTLAGWAWLGSKPPKGTRGGDSVQHEFLVTELARRLPHSTIETLGADLIIAFAAEGHERLHRALETLSATTIALNTGDLIACEVECSRPEATGVRSAQRDASFALTVLAVFGDGDKLRARLASSDHIIIVDVLRLLDACKEAVHAHV